MRVWGARDLVVLRVPEDCKFIRLFAVSLPKIGVNFTRAEGRMGEGERDIFFPADFAGLKPAAAKFLTAIINNPKSGCLSVSLLSFATMLMRDAPPRLRVP